MLFLFQLLIYFLENIYIIYWIFYYRPLFLKIPENMLWTKLFAFSLLWFIYCCCINIEFSVIISCGVFITGGGSGALTCCWTCCTYAGSSCIATALGVDLVLGFGLTSLSSIFEHLWLYHNVFNVRFAPQSLQFTFLFFSLSALFLNSGSLVTSSVITSF